MRPPPGDEEAEQDGGHQRHQRDEQLQVGQRDAPPGPQHEPPEQPHPEGGGGEAGHRAAERHRHGQVQVPSPHG